MKFHLAVLIALSSVLLLNIPNTSSYETREILPSTGFWNYLPVFGIWARIVHYLAVDSEGLGNQVKTLDRYFKNKYTPDKYVKLVNRIVDKLPKVIIAFRVLKIKDNLRNVRDPKTGRTLGEAFDIIHDIGSDDDAVNEISSRLNLVEPDNISMVESSNTNFDLKKTLKNTILEKPSIIGDVLKDPQVVNYVTSGILQYLASDKVVHGIETIQQLIKILEIAHPNMFNEGQNSLTDLRDEKTDMSFIKTLETLLNIILNPKFPEELAKLLNNETMTYLHEKTQDVVSKVIEEKNKKKVNQKPNPSSDTSDEQNDKNDDPDADVKIPKITAKSLVSFLSIANVHLDEETAESILQASENNELGDKASKFLNELSQIEDLTPQKVTQFVNEKGVNVDQKAVDGAIDMISSFDAKMLTSTLKGMGLNIDKDKVEAMKETVAELKKNYEKNHPPMANIRVPQGIENEDLTKPPQSIFHQDDSQKDEKNSEMI